MFIYRLSRYGRASVQLSRERFIDILTHIEGLPKWAAPRLVELAEAQCLHLLATNAKSSIQRTQISPEFFVTAYRETAGIDVRV